MIQTTAMSNAMLGLTFWEGHCVESYSEQPDGSLVLKLTEDPETLALRLLR